jgi:hypothetical protein
MNYSFAQVVDWLGQHRLLGIVLLISFLTFATGFWVHWRYHGNASGCISGALQSLVNSGAAPPSSASHTCYYVSPDGSDSNTGTSPNAPWRTLAKAQNVQAQLRPGDGILLQRGGVWFEQFDIISMNGSNGLPITIGNYGNGILPVIDGGQTSSSPGRNYCIDAINTSYKWITVDGIECRNAYKQGITFKSYRGTGTNGVGIVVQNAYIHHDGAGACTTCGPRPQPDPGGYANQLDAQYTTGVKFVNNTLEHLGGHNALTVHYDKGNAVISGNVVNAASSEPWYNHNGIDVKGGRRTLVSRNVVTCPGCGGAAFYTENTEDAHETISFIGNIAYENWNAFMIDTGGSCFATPCSITAKLYNNTIVNSHGQTNIIDSSCTNHSLDIQKNIIDGGTTTIAKGTACNITWDYNDDGGVYAIAGNPVGEHDLKKVDPRYADASGGNFTPRNNAINSAIDAATSCPYLGAIQIQAQRK